MTDLERLCRAEWGHLLSALIGAFGDFDLAEESLQEAFALAVEQWREGVPRNPSGWLFGTARHKALDRLRRRRHHEASLGELGSEAEPAPIEPGEEIPDERLRLIFTCCHPALSTEAQVALTLRAVCGLTTEEIARAFLVAVPTIAQRLVRAKAKIRDAHIPYAIPADDELGDRVAAVMTVLYLLFNEGYSALQGQELTRPELCERAIELTSLLFRLLGEERAPDVAALLALMLLLDARRATRLDAAGDLVLLQDQERSRWNRERIREGIRLIEFSLRAGATSTYALEAAIAAVHAEAPTAEATDWPQIVRLYELLGDRHPSPVVALNHAVAISMAEGPEKALPRVEQLAGELDSYAPFHATRADLLRRLNRSTDAISAYERALSLTQNAAEQRFYARRIGELRTFS